MVDRVIRNDWDFDQAINLMRSRGYPVTVSIRKGAVRTVEQNRLQRMWLNEAAEQLGDQTSEYLRGYCKLTIGVPIMREASEEFRESYDRIIKPHTYEEKIEMMMEPLDFPVTRLMKTKEKAEYLDRLYEHFTGQGVVLTEPGQG
jgi:hypothetical protein